MPRIRLATGTDGVRYATFCCPGCGYGHGPIIARPAGTTGPTWGWNNDLERPTFTPSLMVQTGPMPTVPAGRPDAGKTHVCHSFIRDGQIQFLSDCTHALAGQTVDLPEND